MIKETIDSITYKELNKLAKDLQSLQDTYDIRKELKEKYAPDLDCHYSKLQVVLPLSFQKEINYEASWLKFSNWVDYPVFVKEPDMFIPTFNNIKKEL